MTTLILIRHGSTDATVNWVLSGRAPGYGLNELGASEVRALSAALSTVPLAAVYSSPLERALQTATAVAQSRSLDVRVHDALTDIDFGGWTGRAVSELEGDPAFVRFNRYRASGRPPRGESICHVQARMVAAIQELAQIHASETLALVSHADPLRLALAYFIGVSVDHAHRLRLEPGSSTALDLREHDAELLYLNRKSPSI